MKSYLFLILFIVCVGMPAVAQDKFINEDGQTSNLTLGDSVNMADVGLFVVEIPFQSPLQDLNTGLFAIPDLEFCYSLRPVNWMPSDFVTNDFPWVYGNESGEASLTILSFDDVTGSGNAKLMLPAGAFTHDGTWGQLFHGGLNRLSIFLDLAGSLSWTALAEPSQYLASKVIDLDVNSPDISLMLTENRSLYVDQDSELVIVAKDVWSTDRVFNLSVTAPIFSVPSSVVLPAGEHYVEVPLTVLDGGEARVSATSPSYPGVHAVSQKGIAVDDVESFDFVVPAGGGPIRIEPNDEVVGSSRRCIHFGPVLPSGKPDNGQSVSYRYSACKKSPQPTCAVNQAEGGYAWFGRSSKCKLTLNIFSWCNFYSSGEDTERDFPKWKLVSIKPQLCGVTGRASGQSVDLEFGEDFEFEFEGKMKYRFACKWVRQATTVDVVSDDCL